MRGSSWSREKETACLGAGAGVSGRLGLHKGTAWAATKLELCWPLPCWPRRGPRVVRASEGLVLYQGALLRLPWGTGDPSVPGEAPNILSPNRKGLAEHHPGTGVVLCHGPEFCFLKVEDKIWVILSSTLRQQHLLGRAEPATGWIWAVQLSCASVWPLVAFIVFTLGHGLSKSGRIIRLVPVYSGMGSYLFFFFYVTVGGILLLTNLPWKPSDHLMIQDNFTEATTDFKCCFPVEISAGGTGWVSN